MRSRVGSVLVLATLILGFFWVFTTRTAHAYIDPGTGSFLIQILLASLFASLFALKVFWQRFTGRLARIVSLIKGRTDTDKSEQ